MRLETHNVKVHRDQDPDADNRDGQKETAH
jgi:hypothetical protein